MVAVLSSFTLSFNMLNWRPEGGCERSPLHVLNQCFTSSLWHLPDRQVVDPQYLFCSQLPVQLAVPIPCLASSEAGDCLQLYRCSDLSLLDVCHIGRWFGRDTTCWPLLHLSSGQQPVAASLQLQDVTHCLITCLLSSTRSRLHNLRPGRF